MTTLLAFHLWCYTKVRGEHKSEVFTSYWILYLFRNRLFYISITHALDL